METTGYCKLCGKIKQHFCCQSCYEKDATKNTRKSALTTRIALLEKELTADLAALRIFRDAVSKTNMITPLWTANRIEALEALLEE